MKTLFTFLIILILAAGLGVVAMQDNGYVLIGRGHTTVEMSLAVFIFLQISIYILISIALRLIKNTWGLPDFIKFRHNRSKSLKAQKASRQGLIALAQGKWKEAEKTLIKNVANSDTPLLNYLSAAKAAQKLNEPERRDHYLSMAHQSMPEADFAVELTQAELQLAHGQLEQSLATLVHLKSISPKHTHVLHLLAQLYEKLNSWKELQALIPELKKHKVCSSKELERIQKRVFTNLIKQAAETENVEHIIATWNEIPKNLKNDHDMVLQYTRLLHRFNADDKAEPILHNAIKQNWNTEFIDLYGRLKSPHPQARLDFAESLLKRHEKNPVLLLALGRICKQLELWGKAQAYFEASLGAEPMVQTYKELGLLMEQLGEEEKASQYFRQGLLLTTPIQ